MKTFLLIDTSYSVFFRFYATMNWYKLNNPEETFDKDYDWLENTQFRDMFEKKYFESFQFLIKKFKIDGSNIFMMRDCPREEIWRNHSKENYKSGRPSFSGGNYFKYTYQTIIPSLIENKKINQVLSQDYLEADDVIAITKKHIRNIYPDSQIIIVTSDHDLLQLIDDNTLIYSLKKKCLNEKSHGNPFTDLHIKIFCGDKSDNIDGCIPKCGEKTALKLLKEPSKIKEKLKDSDILDKYIHNRLIIDFNFIPQELQQKCYATLNTIKF